MKKIFIVTGLLFMLLFGIAQGKTFNEDRWQWFYSNNTYTGKIDTKTLKYHPATDTADVWVVWITPSRHVADLVLYKIDFRNETMKYYKDVLYRDGSDNAYISSDYNGEDADILPGSGNEKLFATISTMTNREKKQAEYQEEQQKEEMEYQANLEKQREQEKKDRENANAIGLVTSIISGLLG